jgi:hypothetical protein
MRFSNQVNLYYEDETSINQGAIYQDLLNILKRIQHFLKEGQNLREIQDQIKLLSNYKEYNIDFDFLAETGDIHKRILMMNLESKI